MFFICIYIVLITYAKLFPIKICCKLSALHWLFSVLYFHHFIKDMIKYCTLYMIIIQKISFLLFCFLLSKYLINHLLNILIYLQEIGIKSFARHFNACSERLSRFLRAPWGKAPATHVINPILPVSLLSSCQHPLSPNCHIDVAIMHNSFSFSFRSELAVTPSHSIFRDFNIPVLHLNISFSAPYFV